MSGVPAATVWPARTCTFCTIAVSGASMTTPPDDVPLRVASATRSRAALSSASATASSACASSSDRRLTEPSFTRRSARCTFSVGGVAPGGGDVDGLLRVDRGVALRGLDRHQAEERLAADHGQPGGGNRRGCLQRARDRRGDGERRSGRRHDLAADRPGARHGALRHRLRS